MTVNTKLLLDGLRAHYRKPGEAQDGEVLLSEVTAPGSNRSCDLLRIGMWASRGLGIDVHELKVSRSDWLRELDDPAKAEAWWPYCNRFWVVAPRGVVKHEELPEGWGLLNPPTNANHRRFKVAIKPADKTPELTLALFTAIVKRTDNTRLAEMDQLRQAHQKATREAVMAERARCEERGLSPEAEQKLKAIAQLEELLGVELTDSPFGWGGAQSLHAIDPGELATAIREYTHDHVALQRHRQQLNNDHLHHHAGRHPASSRPPTEGGGHNVQHPHQRPRRTRGAGTLALGVWPSRSSTVTTRSTLTPMP